MRSNRNLAWTLLALSATVALVAFAYPLYVIRPFRAQGARELAVALEVSSWGPLLALLAASGAVVLATLLWRKNRWLPRIVSLLLTFLTVGSAALSRINLYELMFHPIPAVESIPAAMAKLDVDDMVMAVKAAGHARAYPIRMMGYHHIVNDWLGGVPLVGTY